MRLLPHKLSKVAILGSQTIHRKNLASETAVLLYQSLEKELMDQSGIWHIERYLRKKARKTYEILQTRNEQYLVRIFWN